MVNLTRKQKELAILALHFPRTEDLAVKIKRSRATAFRYVGTLLSAGILAHGPSGRYVEGEHWSEHFDHIDSGWGESQGASLAGASETETPPSPPRLAHRPRFEHGEQVFYFLAEPPLEFLASLKPFAHNRRGEATTWAKKVKDPGGLGTIDFYVGRKGGMSATFHLTKRPMPVPSLTRPGEVDRQIEETFQIWKRRIEAQYGLRLTPKGVPVMEAKSKESGNGYRTGELEWSVEGVRDITSEKLEAGLAVDGSPDESGKRKSSIALGDQDKVREMARFATGGGFEALMSRLDAVERSTSENRAVLEKIAGILERLVPKEPQGVAPPKDDGDHPEFG